MSVREYFKRVKRTVMRRPAVHHQTDVMGQQGSARALDATLYGGNWHRDIAGGLVEIYDAGAALVFRDLLPRREKYAREGLYLQLSIAYRTTENAFANIRTFSGSHVTLPNSVQGAMYVDPNTYSWVTEDMTLNVNSIYSGEKLWIQRVDWEWVSRDIVYDDEIGRKGVWLERSRAEVDAIYAIREISGSTARDYLIERVRKDENFAKRCLALLCADQLMQRDIVSLYRDLGVESSE